MSETWFAIPVHANDAEKAGETFQKWRDKGYKTMALIVDGAPKPDNCQRCTVKEYKGWSWAVNYLCGQLPQADWIVTGGYDIYPDPNRTAQEIAKECTEHFAGTCGVMQPAGDKYGGIANRTACVSPWLGKDFRERINGGTGVLWEPYGHYYSDSELLKVSEMLGCLWWREDLIQFHDHYTRENKPVPESLKPWSAGIAAAKALFAQRLAQNFPGHELKQEPKA